ncbi:D-aminopeptidase [Halobacillus karajensis]|uniref:L-aminopeptidase/D-esterase n=1 Tax=Halobacillus karajensis TaxID=195088 RepID=A0A059NVI0_9BACI|nr:P1 family peptidase [Halobacillus karajensis]CDQ18579.1 L-aminopeptidase/D-esterase [Halobacillus karajensis]CDQ23349.1 L-aminopeptidase/D-esterase [Halobacillus karajensis]CDQ26831.1 L-aminopeptidase/D-esterase [Halobacillus karajensis]SEH49639.1 D-aminopeptidase [Halobacillus karajensis]
MNQTFQDRLKIGGMLKGPRNKITDVPGVSVGHATLSKGEIQTGVTAILPHQGNLFQNKVIATSHVINGFGKTTGTIQMAELGTLETPIVLTNTLSVGTAYDSLVSYTLERNPEVGRTTGTVNPVIGECNDMYLNDIRKQAVKKEHVRKAVAAACKDFQEGSVGAGRGMICYSLKGGIGSSSRIIQLEHDKYTLGVLTLTNFGKLSDLSIDGRPIGSKLKEFIEAEEEKDRGSVMIIVATNLPVTDRQLKRICKRAVTGLSRTGTIIGNGSGEIVLGFSTAATIPHEKTSKPLTFPAIHEEDIDEAFRAIGEATEEAVLTSLFQATPVTGREGHERPTLTELLKKYPLL